MVSFLWFIAAVIIYALVFAFPSTNDGLKFVESLTTGLIRGVAWVALMFCMFKGLVAYGVFA